MIKQRIQRNIISWLHKLPASIMNTITEYCCSHVEESDIPSLKMKLAALSNKYPGNRFYRSITQEINEGQAPNSFRLMILALCL